MAMAVVPVGRRSVGRTRKWMNGIKNVRQNVRAWENWRQQAEDKERWRTCLKYFQTFCTRTKFKFLRFVEMFLSTTCIYGICHEGTDVHVYTSAV